MKQISVVIGRKKSTKHDNFFVSKSLYTIISYLFPLAGITIGMAVLGAVYYTLGKYSEEVPIINIDVDLRRRFECQKDKKDLPPQVALIIGMVSLMNCL